MYQKRHDRLEQTECMIFWTLCIFKPCALNHVPFALCSSRRFAGNVCAYVKDAVVRGHGMTRCGLACIAWFACENVGIDPGSFVGAVGHPSRSPLSPLVLVLVLVLVQLIATE